MNCEVTSQKAWIQSYLFNINHTCYLFEKNSPEFCAFRADTSFCKAVNTWIKTVIII